MREVGLNPDTGGGKRGDAKRLREQMQRLFRCHISFDQVMSLGNAEGNRWVDMQVAPEGELWWDIRQPEQLELFNSWIELGEKFFEAVTAAPVPADMRALRALRRSPLALDLYAWATYRAFSVSRKGAPQFVPWRSLMRQMGCDYDEVSNFRKKANKALRKVRAVYPALKIKNKLGGFDILPCPPAVPPAAKSLARRAGRPPRMPR